MEGDNGALVILTNWSPQPLDAVTVAFPGLPNTRHVRSLRAAGFFQGTLSAQQSGVLEINKIDGVPVVTLPLALTDFLFID
jgi:hypothetical protein